MSRHSPLLLSMLIALTLIGVHSPASADVYTFRIKSEHPKVVSVKFYSTSRNHGWPGSKRVWLIKDYELHFYRLTCRRGEKICFGAWIRNRSRTYWGMGTSKRTGCKSCCYVCYDGRQSEPIRLR